MSKQIELFEGKVLITIPDTINEITQEQAQEIFGENLPDILYGNEQEEVYISAGKTGQACDDADIEKRLSEYFVLYRRIVPGWDNVKMVKKELDNGKVLGVFNYTSTTATNNYLNYFVLMSVDGQEIIMTMHCNLRKSAIYGAKFMTMLNMLKIH